MAKSSDNKHLRDFGLRLDEVMKEKHCTAIELAKVLGLSRQAIDNYRSGISAPPISKLLKMSEWFGVTVDWLLCRENAVRTLDTNTAKVCQYTGLSENMEIKLKPCPFCGSAAKLDDSELYYAIQGERGSACLGVTCENHACGAGVTAYNHTGGPLPYEVMAKMAAEKWNRRA